MATDIVPSSRSTPRFYRSKAGGNLLSFQPSTCVSTALIQCGDVVQLDVNTASNNFRIVKASTMANVPNVISTALVGISGGQDTSDGSTLGLLNRASIPVFVGTADSEFIFATKATVAQHQSTLINTARAIGYDSTLNIFYCDVANSTAGDLLLRVTDVLDPGSSGGYVVARFRSTAVTVTTVR